MANGKLSKDIIKKLIRKYRRQPGVKVGDSRKISQMLKKGVNIPTYLASKGRHVTKKRKTTYLMEKN